MSSKEVSENLFQMMLEGKWDEVVKIYESNKSTHKEKITQTGGTALHAAVTQDEEEIVSKLVQAILKEDREALGVENNVGYTALHHEASVGSKSMCKCIAEAYPQLISRRTKRFETPLFIAALNGKKDAFLCLHEICFASDQSMARCYSDAKRARDGSTILHAAIERKHFDLAYFIINKYGDLVNSADDKGLTPVHILAAKSSAFKSGSNLGILKGLIYKCIAVDHELNLEYLSKPQSEDRNNGVQNADEESQTKNPSAERPCRYFKSVFANFKLSLLLIILGLGLKMKINCIQELKELKQKHKWSVKILDELFNRSKSKSIYKYIEAEAIAIDREVEDEKKAKTVEVEEKDENKAEEVNQSTKMIKADPSKKKKMIKADSILLIAAKNGVTEVVDKVLKVFPVAIQDRDGDHKSIVILAAENRQVGVYNLLIKKNVLRESIVRKVDSNSNSVLHAAAIYKKDKPWPIPGVAPQMQWEIKWFEYVKASLPPGIMFRRNNDHETPEEVFSKTHKDLVKESREWLIKTSESCSVVAALIAGVAFATSASIPGGTHDDSGKPNFENRPAFQVFSISSLIALCFSLTALVMFLSIITSRFLDKDFSKNLPGKLLLGLTSLFLSIGSMLICFCSGHFLLVQHKFKHVAFPVYAMTCLPVSIFAVAHFPLYVDLLFTTFLNPFHYSNHYHVLN